MKITSKILSIPPYISTTWRNISSLHVHEEGGLFCLTIFLHDGSRAKIPGLNKASVTAIFEAHSRFADTEKNAPADQVSGEPASQVSSFSFSLPAPLGDESVQSSIAPFQHDPSQAKLPALPKEMMQKIVAVAKALGIYEVFAHSEAEADCQCMHCQVVRTIRSGEEEIVSEEDLKFRNWDIQQTADHLYLVTNPLDPNEHYNVFLGTPLGCTCGEKDCEHIRAVLST